jgi:hypothetical protein
LLDVAQDSRDFYLDFLVTLLSTQQRQASTSHLRTDGSRH